MPLANRRPAAPSAPVLRATGATARPSARRATRSFVIDVPFEMRSVAQLHGASWDSTAKAYIYRGDTLPEGLAAFRAQPYSWERFREDELNGTVAVAVAPQATISLRPHQTLAAHALRRAVQASRPGFLVADDVGLGKTIETWAGILELSSAETVLIVCPLAVVAHWRRTIRAMGDRGKRIVVINYERLKKLFEVPAQIASKPSRAKKNVRKVRTQKGIAKYGEPCQFEVIVWDESQRLRNVDSARSKMALRLNSEADFVVWLSATAGQDPLELAYLAPLLAAATGARARDLKDYESWCQSYGIGVVRGAYGKWTWRGNAKELSLRAGADEDLEKVRALLFDGPIPAGIRRTPADIAGWPEINRILLPVELDAPDRLLYAEAWDEFRNQLGLERRGRLNASNALVARLRLRQKASLLRTAATVDHAVELLEQGLQVAISVSFLETLETIRDALAREGYPCSEIHGALGGPAKEAQRLEFQHGRKRVCVYTVEEGISLHQGEHNEAPRANLIHDLRWSAIQMKQIEGRTHRDGRFSQVYWMLGADTVEEQLADVVAGRMRSMSVMQGDKATQDDIERVLARLAELGRAPA